MITDWECVICDCSYDIRDGNVPYELMSGKVYCKQCFEEELPLEEPGVEHSWEYQLCKYENQNQEDGFPNGLFQAYGRSGSNLVLECNFQGGKLHGPFKAWYESGRTAVEGFYEKGLRHGLFREWFDKENPTLNMEGEYSHGRMIGKRSFFYFNGVKKFEEFFLEGEKMHGEQICRYEDGSIQCNNIYEGGKLLSSTYWHRNGTKSHESTFVEVEGRIQKHGVCRTWFEDGHLRSEVTYASGESVGEDIHWVYRPVGVPDSEGEVIEEVPTGYHRVVPKISA